MKRLIASTLTAVLFAAAASAVERPFQLSLLPNLAVCDQTEDITGLARALREQQTEAQQLLEAVQHALELDGILLGQDERLQIEGGMAALRGTLQLADHLAIKRAITALNDATVGFAQKRMDKSVARVLAGRNISELEVK